MLMISLKSLISNRSVSLLCLIVSHNWLIISNKNMEKRCSGRHPDRKEMKILASCRTNSGIYHLKGSLAMSQMALILIIPLSFKQPRQFRKNQWRSKRLSKSNHLPRRKGFPSLKQKMVLSKKSLSTVLEAKPRMFPKTIARPSSLLSNRTLMWWQMPSTILALLTTTRKSMDTSKRKRNQAQSAELKISGNSG